MKPLPHGVRKKLSKPVPTRSFRRVEQLCFFFFVRKNPTVGLAGILERSGSLSLSRKSQNGYCDFILPFTFSFPLFYSFLFAVRYFSLSFSPHFLLSLCISLLLFGALIVWVKRRKLPPLLPLAKCVDITFPFLFFYFIIPLHDIITYMAQCEPWNSCHPCGSM